MADCFHDCKKRSPTRVLATAIYYTLEKKYFDERTPRAEITTMFCITMAQLTKAVMGVDYESVPHSSAKKRKTTDATQTMPSKVTKTTADSTPSTSKTGNPAMDNAPALAKPSQSKKGHGVTESYPWTVQHSNMTPCHHPVTLIPCQKCLSSELFSHSGTHDISLYYNYNP